MKIITNKYITFEKMDEFCKQNHYFDKGTEDDYENLMGMIHADNWMDSLAPYARLCKKDLLYIADMICEHTSFLDQEKIDDILAVMTGLANISRTFFTYEEA